MLYQLKNIGRNDEHKLQQREVILFQ